MNVRELHELLGTMLGEHGDKEVAISRTAELSRVTSVSICETTGDPHGKPTFARLAYEDWSAAEWRH